MPLTIHSAVLHGIDVVPVQVEVDVMRGLPGFYVVGLPGSSVREARERVRSSLVAHGKIYPLQRLVINLAPASIPKQTTSFDVPIAVGILAATGQVPRTYLEQTLFVGELSLGGDLRPVAGIYSLCEYAARSGFRYVCFSATQYGEVASVGDIEKVALPHLGKVEHFLRTGTYEKCLPVVDIPPDLPRGHTFDDVVGQEAAKYALMIAASGGHNILLEGPPGCGKTMLATALAGLLPPLTDTEAAQVQRIYSAAMVPRHPSRRDRPFRQVHHQSSVAALLGGGTIPKPGEVSLAHLGVLFLDEFLEFRRESMESLREPLEDKWITLQRKDCLVQFPAHCMVVAAMNPCPCGFGDMHTPCACTVYRRKQYREKLSGPLLDRFDMHVLLERVTGVEQQGLSGEEVLRRIARARSLAAQRGKFHGFFTNSDIPVGLLKSLCSLEHISARRQEAIFSPFGLSMRGRARVLRVARTLADLGDREKIGESDLLQALHFRLNPQSSVMP